ncbi:MAG: DUF2628 domain-containing protein [Firmicutes bacterium]|nr:DUF2628 domain-containing protein [Bacillota bacterium]
METFGTNYRERLIEKNVEYYAPRLAKLDEDNTKVSWNWFAFLVPFCYFAYRKLYLECATYYLLTNGLNAVITQLLTSHGIVVNIGWTIDIVAMFFSGLYGNWLYKCKLDRQVEKCVSLPLEDRDKYIKRHSGTSVLAIIIAFCITITIAGLLYKFYPRAV